MKNFLKALIWLGLGGGLGFFGGVAVGRRMEWKAINDEAEEQSYTDLGSGVGLCRHPGLTEDEWDRMVREYRGEDEEETGDNGGSKPVDLPQDAAEWVHQVVEQARQEDERRRPAAPGDNGGSKPTVIRQLHPQDMTPVILTEEEYDRNDKNLERAELIFYGLDEVLYDVEKEEVVGDPDGLIGVGTLFGFGGDPDNPTDVLYVENETMGKIYRITYVDDAFCDIFHPQSPDDDYPEEGDYD